MITNALGWDEYDDYVDICYVRTQTHISKRKPLCLEDKLTMGTLEDSSMGNAQENKSLEGIPKDLDEGYGTIYIGALEIL